MILEVINVFNPIINKYGRLLGGEDTKQDLRLHMVNVIKKIPLDTFREKNNKTIFTYFANSLKYEYIRLSKKARSQNTNEATLDFEEFMEHTPLGSDIELLEMMEVLSKKEAFIIDCIFTSYLSVTEVAQYLGISRQAVNQSKKKALEKIKNLYFVDDTQKKKAL
ncbi:sigma factor-like helix-turn-helix DNA-binding protein [Jeotgalibacillus proteolyticus]|uniref:sigma factor-like helix-turn-helix DNA-binding protein n=1 Tax=Jeotgalibacillus proteolyticus TaxID=2082395 RepID=UPI003CF88356